MNTQQKQRQERQPLKRNTKTNVQPSQNMPKLQHMKKILAFKMILIGQAGVGKTSLIQRFIQSSFVEGSQSTVGVELHSKVIQIDQKQIKINIWDTAGQECYHSLVRSFYRNCQAIIMVYSITNYYFESQNKIQIKSKEQKKISHIIQLVLSNIFYSKDSFIDIENWHRESESQVQSDEIIKILIGTQCDKENQRQVSKEEAQRYANQKGFNLFFETSSLWGDNVDIFFETCAKVLYKRSLFKEKMEERENQLKKKRNSDESKTISLRSYDTRKQIPVYIRNDSCC